MLDLTRAHVSIPYHEILIIAYCLAARVQPASKGHSADPAFLTLLGWPFERWVVSFKAL